MTCEREFDVLDAVMSGRWPDGCDEDLRMHAHHCEICHDLIQVAHAVRTDHLEDLQHVTVPPSGVVWWKAQRRARQEAVTAAQRAITAVQTGTIAAAVVIGLAIIGGLGALVARFTDVFDFQWIHRVTPSADVMILAGFLTVLVLTPIAVWFMVHED